MMLIVAMTRGEGYNDVVEFLSCGRCFVCLVRSLVILSVPYMSSTTSKQKDFPLFREDCRFTDDTVMTIAVRNALRIYDKKKDIQSFQAALIAEMQRLGRKYADRGYGGRFAKWLWMEDPKPLRQLWQWRCHAGFSSGRVCFVIRGGAEAGQGLGSGKP